MSGRTWTTLDKHLFGHRPESVQLRVDGHYGQPCDLSFVSGLENVRNFSVDSIHEATNLEALAALEEIEALGIGIFELDSFSVLADLPATIRSLSLGATRSKKP